MTVTFLKLSRLHNLQHKVDIQLVLPVSKLCIKSLFFNLVLYILFHSNNSSHSLTQECPLVRVLALASSITGKMAAKGLCEVHDEGKNLCEM